MDPSKKSERKTEIIDDAAFFTQAQRKPAPKKRKTQGQHDPAPSRQAGVFNLSRPQNGAISKHSVTKRQQQPVKKAVVMKKDSQGAPNQQTLPNTNNTKASTTKGKDGKVSYSQTSQPLNKVNLAKLPKIPKISAVMEQENGSKNSNRAGAPKAQHESYGAAAPATTPRHHEQQKSLNKVKLDKPLEATKKPVYGKDGKKPQTQPPRPSIFHKKKPSGHPKSAAKSTSADIKKCVTEADKAESSDEFEEAFLRELDASLEAKPATSQDLVKGLGNKKRKSEEKGEPAPEGQTAKKLKTHHVDEHVTTPAQLNPLPTIAKSHKDQVKVDFPEPMDSTRFKSHPTKVHRKRKAADQIPDDERIQWYMEKTGLNPEDLDNSTKIVRLKREDRIITVTTNPTTGKTILHDTGVPRIQHGASTHLTKPTQAKERPFMKEGKHGRGGDFDEDADRRTGRGHQVTDEDQLRRAYYSQWRGDIFREYPRYPHGEDITPEVNQRYRENELWFIAFKERYPSNAIMSLWPCGCEKLRDDSDDEESEEE